MLLRALTRRSFSSLPPFTKVTLPALSPTMAEGGLAKWRKQPGDKIGPGEVLCEIETDKATMDFEFQEVGWIYIIPASSKVFSYLIYVSCPNYG
jgi:pyruvate dehydrogenase E2 component (dihydrolipoamide acetyltransferase)